MTDHPMHDDDQAVSNRLARHQHTLDDNLDSFLDIEAGLQEILIQSRHDTAVNALGTVLNTEAGLAGILTPPPQPQAPSGTPSTHHHLRAGASLPALSPADRMALREHPDIKDAQRALAHDLAGNRDRNLPLALAHDLASALARDLGHAGARDPDLARTRDLNLARARNRALDLVRVLVRARDLALDLARNGDLSIDLGLARARDLDRDLVRVLARARNRDLDLDLDLARALVLARDLDRDLALALDLARTLDFNPAHGLTPARGLARDAFIKVRANEVCRAIGTVLRQEPPALDAASVTTLLNDFTHDDLRAADLKGLDFSGVHWSQCTRWPPTVDIEALKARSDETPPGSGIWIVRSGTTTVRDSEESPI
ncbi:hypothetical protein [Streptomyces sp. NPDC057682]|uniref:hypothetical protein n=1 Tax=Streptomyces sp. NPDC057682 TaxID=3346210 RepID=UPI0036B100D0